MLSQLSRQLKREMAANPKRAIVLGLLLVVATYYWVPLVSGWIGSDEETSAKLLPKAKPESTLAVQVKEEQIAKTSVTSQKKSNWRIIYQAMEDDRRTSLAINLPKLTNAFRILPSQIEKHNLQSLAGKSGSGSQSHSMDDQIKKSANRKKIDLNTLNLALASTIVGRNRKVALINDATVAEGKTFFIPNPNFKPDSKNTSTKPMAKMIAIQLVKVQSKSVTLKYKDQSRDVWIPRDQLTGNNRVQKLILER